MKKEHHSSETGLPNATANKLAWFQKNKIVQREDAATLTFAGSTRTAKELASRQSLLSAR